MNGPLHELDLYAGLEGWSKPFRDRGHDVFSVDIDERFDVDLHADILELEPHDLPWRPNIICASPPCEALSVLRIGPNWTGPRDYPAHQPKTDAARMALRLAARTLWLIEQLQPAFFVIENPRGKLRKLPPLGALERRSVSYCSYGAPWQKPTDLWGGFPPSLELRPMCSPGADCHVPAPRGSRTGIQSDTNLDTKHERVAQYFRGGAIAELVKVSSASEARRVMVAARAQIPYLLAADVCRAAEVDMAAGRHATDYQPSLWEALA